jgi:hypothetical protein
VKPEKKKKKKKKEEEGTQREKKVGIQWHFISGGRQRLCHC